MSSLKDFYRPTRYPIVLCHGLFGYDRMGIAAIPGLQFHYWRGVKSLLTKAGCEVLVARVPPTASIESRAIALRDFLDKHLSNRNVNLICHSMGGLDSRHLVTHVLPESPQSTFQIRSLTTVATPHRGSPVMDWIRDAVGVGLSEGDKRAVLLRFMSALDAPAYSNLTTDFCTQVFNPTTPDDPNVSYFSYAAMIKRIKHDVAPETPKETRTTTTSNVSRFSPILLPYEIVKQKEGDNDGFVSVYSARWGRFVKTVVADHLVLTRYNNPASPGKSPLAAVDVAKLYNALIPISFDFGIQFDRLKILGDVVQRAVSLGHSVASIVPKTTISNVIHSITPVSSPDKLKPANSLYKKRVSGLLDQMYGVEAFDDYIYGYDTVPGVPAKRPLSDEGIEETEEKLEEPFNTKTFYLEMMDSLARRGF